MHATALKRKLRNTQSQWGKNTFKWPFFKETGKVGSGKNPKSGFFLLKGQFISKGLLVSSFRPKKQRNFFKDFCPSL